MTDDPSLKLAPADQVYKGLPVHGYQPQSDTKVALVNEFKQDEERLLRKLDALSSQTFHLQNADGTRKSVDPRWLAIARTGFEQAFMALNRAVFQPQRISLPEDNPEYEMTAYGRRPDGSIGEMTPEEYAAALQRDLP